jgi:uncharacterized membrane protein
MADFRLALLLLVRSRLGITIALLTLLVVSGAWLASQFSPRQPATVALDVGLSFIRILIPFLALLQSQELVAREVERRLIMSSPDLSALAFVFHPCPLCGDYGGGDGHHADYRHRTGLRG